MKVIKQKKVCVYVIRLLIQLFTWVSIITASEDLSQTIGTLRASRSVKWRDEVAPDKKLQEEFDLPCDDVRFVRFLTRKYPRSSSVGCFAYRNMPDDSDLMQESMDRQRLKLELLRSKKIELDEHVGQEIAKEDRRQKEMAENLESTIKKEMPVAVKKVEEEVVAFDAYAQILFDLSRCMGLQ